MSLLLVGAVAWSLRGDALAEPPTTITTGGEPCEGASLEERVRTYVSYEQQEKAGLAVDAHLRRSSDGQWLLDLEIDKGGDASLRQLVAPHCETVLDAAAFVVAVAIDPSLASEGAVEPPVPEPTVPVPTTTQTAPVGPTAPQPPPITTSATPPPPKRRKVHAIVRAGGGIDGGALPRVGAMFEGAIGVGGKWFRVEATGMYRLQTTEYTVADPTVGAGVAMWSFGARGCGVPRYKRVEFPLCAALEGGRQIAQGTGLNPNRTLRTPWGAATFGPGVAFKAHKNIAIVIMAALGVPFVRTSLTAENLGTIYRTGPVFGRLWLGFEGRFP